MIGAGMICMDVALFMAAILAAAVNLYYLPACWRQDHGIALMRALRLAGWATLGTRLGFVLFTTGDVLITVAGSISIFFLATGEIAAVFNRGKQVQL